MPARYLGEVVMWSGVAFLVIALLVGIATALQALETMRVQAEVERAAAERRAELFARSDDRDYRLALATVPPTPLPTLFDALGKLIEVLAKAPSWFAMYLGGFALLYLSATLASPMSPPPAAKAAVTAVRTNPPVRTTQTRTEKTTETRTEASRSSMPMVASPTPTQ